MASPELIGNRIVRTVCSHCGETISNGDSKKEFCRYCDSKEKREEMDKNNKELFESRKSIFKCKYCLRSKEKQNEEI